MTIEQMKKRIDVLEESIFFLEMKDFHNNEDRMLLQKWNKEVKELQIAMND